MEEYRTLPPFGRERQVARGAHRGEQPSTRFLGLKIESSVRRACHRPGAATMLERQVRSLDALPVTSRHHPPLEAIGAQFSRATRIGGYGKPNRNALRNRS